jgi:uncharacterized protein
MSVIATISQLFRYPVKSMNAERLQAARVTDKIEGDREWGVFDVASEKLLSAKTIPALLHVQARTTKGQAEILVKEHWQPVGHVIVDQFLSALLGRAVACKTATAGMIANIDQEVDDGEMAASELVTFETHPGSLFDSRSPLHLISDATLNSLDRDHLDGAGMWQRYRPNFVVTGVAAMEEDSWIDRRFAIGSDGLIVSVRKRTERCVLTSRAQPNGVMADRSLLRFLNQQRNFCVGIYLQIEQGGVVAVGDSMIAV